MVGFGAFLNYLISIALTGLLTKLGQKYVWGNKKIDGSQKSDWAPSPQGLSWFAGGYQAFKEEHYRALTRWSHEVGQIFTVHLGFRRFLVLNSHAAVKTALLDQAQLNSSRLPLDTFEKIMTDQSKTVFSAPFEMYWARLRRGIHRGLSHLPKVQPKRLPLGTRLEPAELRQLVNLISMDHAISLVFGQHPEPLPPLIETQTSSPAAPFFPILNGALDLKNLFTLNTDPIQYRNRLLDALLPLFDPIMKLRGDRPWSTQDHQAFKIDSILKSLIQLEPSRNDPDPIQFQKDELLINGLQLTLHGQQMLSSSLFTVLQRVAGLPDLQERLLKGPEVLWYGVVKESLRLDPVQPLLAFGSRLDHEVEGYRVDMDTVIVVNLEAVHEGYERPGEFWPERWLDKETPDLLSFGVGRRGCLGREASLEWLVAHLKQILKEYRLEGGDVKEKEMGQAWSWVGRSETKGSAIEFIKKS